MKYDYSSLAATAVGLIDKFGRDTTLRTNTVSGTEFDPTIVATDETISAVFMGYKTNEVDGTLIKSNDKMILTYAVIDLKNEIIDGGKKYEVVNVQEVKPGITPMIYKVQLRS
jgi:hypothetical protein